MKERQRNRENVCLQSSSDLWISGDISFEELNLEKKKHNIVCN